MKKKYWIPLLIIVILICVRIALPYWVTDYVNNTLDQLEEYEGTIAGVDLHLYRGAFTIDSLEIDKIDDNNTVPFVYIDEIDISVDWGAIFKGAFVGEIVLINPVVNFVAPNEDDGEFGIEEDWTEPLHDLMPIQINRFAIVNGTVHYLDFSSSPQVDLPIYSMEMEILNISNADNIKADLPSHIELYAASIGSGYLSLIADAYLLKRIPDVDATFEFEQVDITSLNDFLKAYAAVDAEGGEFNVYSEIIIKDGQLEGYVKPIITGLKIMDLEEGNVAEKAWEAIVGFVTEIFENQREDQFATEVPLEGDLNHVKAGTYPAIWNIFRNAFVKAFSKEAGGEIKFEEQ